MSCQLLEAKDSMGNYIFERNIFVSSLATFGEPVVKLLKQICTNNLKREIRENMTRSKSFPMQCVKSQDGETRTWVILMEKNILNDNVEDSNKTPDIVKLRHPRTGTCAMFFFSSDNTIVQEVFSFSGKKKSWFINDLIKEDGRLYLSTPVDPSFLILPYLKKAKEEGKVIPLDDLLVDNLFPETSRLLKCSALKNIHMLADKKGDDDLNAWTYNEDKIMEWLSKKTKRVAKVLEEKNILIKGAVSENFVASTKDEVEKDREFYLSYACGLVSEYLTEDLSSKLYLHLNLSVQPSRQLNKRKSCESDEQGEVKKMRKDTQPSNISKSEKQNRSSSSKEKCKIKTSPSSQTITSFFKKN